MSKDVLVYRVVSLSSLNFLQIIIIIILFFVLAHHVWFNLVFNLIVESKRVTTTYALSVTAVPAPINLVSWLFF